MKHYLPTLVAALVISFQVSGQSAYSGFVRKADSLYRAKQWRGSAETYSKAFSVNGGQGAVSHRYNAACSWALAGETDSAFYHLERIAGPGNYTDFAQIARDEDLISLRRDARWDVLLRKIRNNKDKEDATPNKPLTTKLDSIYEEDQKYRRRVSDVEKEHGMNSKEMYELWQTINHVDSLNLIEVSKILDAYGWLGHEVVGRIGNAALFLVIQHAHLDTQEKYLPMMRNAVRDGRAEGSSLALLEDRVAMRQGRKQIYGSQITRDENGVYQIVPIEDEVNVNKRRAEVGLEPLEDYAQRWGISYAPLSDH